MSVGVTLSGLFRPAQLTLPLNRRTSPNTAAHNRPSTDLLTISAKGQTADLSAQLVPKVRRVSTVDPFTPSEQGKQVSSVRESEIAKEAGMLKPTKQVATSSTYIGDSLAWTITLTKTYDHEKGWIFHDHTIEYTPMGKEAAENLMPAQFWHKITITVDGEVVAEDEGNILLTWYPDGGEFRILRPIWHGEPSQNNIVE